MVVLCAYCMAAFVPVGLNKRLAKKALLSLRLPPKSSFMHSKLTHESGFSSSLLGIECKHSLLSYAASVTVLESSQA